MNFPTVTDGEIAVINLESARRQAWTRFTQDNLAPRVAEAVVDSERVVAQYLGDLDAFDRLESLATQFARADHTFRAALVEAEVASSVHRFDDARGHLKRARLLGAPRDAVERQALAIDQARGLDLEPVLAARRRLAESGRLEDQIPLGALLADLGRFAEADAVYQDAFSTYTGISPFPLAWVCFQLGMLWGELAHAPNSEVAARWYRRAITCLPGYVHARVHLAEIHTSQDRPRQAEVLLRPALASRDPEVPWRLADALMAQGRSEEARVLLEAARRGFEDLLRKHPLAFADHGAEFFAGSGADPRRALSLARVNFKNRPTRRALEQAHAIAASA